MNAAVTTLAIIPPNGKPIRLAPRRWFALAVGLLRKFGPYAALELLLPGGSLLAILLWLYKRQQAGGFARPAIEARD